MSPIYLVASTLWIFAASLSISAQPAMTDDAPLQLPATGAHQMRVLSPDVLELTLITTKAKDAPVQQWDFVGRNGRPRLPDASQFVVLADGKTNAVKSVGFKRR